MKIANIIYEKKLVNHTKAEYINYFNEPVDYNSIDKSLPTLYVGWSFMKASNPNDDIIQNVDILKKKIITNELYWEFNFVESKSSHIKGVDKFTILAPQFYFTPRYTYINLDPVFFQLRDLQDIMDVVPKQIDYLYNYKNEMIYILKDNKITGINLKMYEFFQFDIKEIINLLVLRITNTVNVVDDSDGMIYQKYYKIFPNFEFLKRYLVTILSK